MKIYVNDGNIVTLTAPRALASGDGALVGALFGVAQTDAEDGATVALVLTGVMTLTKVTSQSWTAGTTKVYWDDANHLCTSTASGNKLIGVAVSGAASGTTTGDVRLNGVAV